MQLPNVENIQPTALAPLVDNVRPIGIMPQFYVAPAPYRLNVVIDNQVRPPSPPRG